MNGLKKYFSEWKTFRLRLWLSLCALALIPAAYQTIRTFLIASGNQEGVFDIIGQMEWFDLINETLQAFLIVPLYSVLNRIFQNEQAAFPAAVFKTGICACALYTLFSVGVLLYGTNLISAMNPGEIDKAAADVYLRLETVAFMSGIAVSFANVVFVVIGKDKNVYIFLAVRTALSLLADFLLIPRFALYGAVVSNILVNALLAAVCILLLFWQGCLAPRRFEKADGSMLLAWCKTGLFSGLGQFLDNLIYAVMVCRMVNSVAEQGNYWIANNFIWGWLLIPITALAEVIRSDCKEGYQKLRKSRYYLIVAASVALWFATMPLWIPFFRYAQGLSNADEIFVIVKKLVPFYIVYAGCAVIDSIFIGLGKTEYTAVNSLLINFGYYGVFFILYRSGAVSFDMNTIILMFGFGMIFHFIISFVQEKLILRKKESKANAVAP